jgi:glyoxylase I family protein
MNLLHIHHIAIICSDYEKSKQFYTEVLGLNILNETYREERQSYKLDLAIGDNYQIELFSFPSPPNRLNYPEGTGLRHIAFAVDSVENSIIELKKKGVNIESVRVDQTTGKKFTFLFDPDNQPIELYEI